MLIFLLSPGTWLKGLIRYKYFFWCSLNGMSSTRFIPSENMGYLISSLSPAIFFLLYFFLHLVFLMEPKVGYRFFIYIPPHWCLLFLLLVCPEVLQYTFFNIVIMWSVVQGRCTFRSQSPTMWSCFSTSTVRGFRDLNAWHQSYISLSFTARAFF